MDISKTSFNFSSLFVDYSQGSSKEPAGLDFKSVMEHCAGEGCDAPKQASFSASITNIDITAFSFESESRRIDPLREFIDALFDHVTGADKEGRTSTSEQAGGGFGFTSDFQSVFGSSGPLIDFINATTANLGLSKEKNLSLQQIAINNQDATRSRESIDKIAAELSAAGITA